VLEALRRALRQRRPRPGLVHHSDRGVQYASLDYTARLEQHGIRISMSRMLQMAGWFRADAASCLPPKAFQSLWILGYVLG